MQIPSSLTSAISLLSASTGPDGARAQVASAERGAGWGGLGRMERDPDALRQAVRSGDQASMDRVGELSRASGIHPGAGSDALTIDADMVESVHTGAQSDGPEPTPAGPDNDAVAIRARYVNSVYTGAGRDAVAIQADLVESVCTGGGADSLSITAGAVRGIHTGDGDDAVVIDAVLGSSQGYGWTRNGRGPASADAKAAVPTGEPARTGSTAEIADAKAETAATALSDRLAEVNMMVGPQTAALARAAERSPEEVAVAQRMRAAQTNYADVHLGAGDDALSVRVDEVISVRGGQGDDVISIDGGTVALHFEAGDGNDRISVAKGATVAVQLERGMDIAARWDGDALVLTLGGGSMRIEGAKGAAAIGIMEWGAPDPAILNMASALDRRA